MSRFPRIAPVLAAILLQAGCASSLLSVVEPPPQDRAGLAADADKTFQLQVSDLLGTEESAKGAAYVWRSVTSRARKLGWQARPVDGASDLHVAIKLSAYNSGSRTARWFFGDENLGQLSGKGQLRMEVTFSVDGQDAGKIVVNSEIEAGFFGGSIREAVGSGVQKIVKYVDRHFG